MPVTKSSPDGGKTTYYENPDLAARLRSKGVKAEVGKRSSNMTQEQRMAKSREYAARKQPERGNSRNRTTSPTTQPVARPNGAQGPLMQNGSYSPQVVQAQRPVSNQLPYSPMQSGVTQGPMVYAQGTGGLGESQPMNQIAPPPAQTFAQRGAPAQPAYNPLPQNRQMGAPPQTAYNPLPTYSTQPVQRPSVFSQPNSSMTMGIQGMGQVNHYGASMNPAQIMSGYQPPVSNPWRRQW